MKSELIRKLIDKSNKLMIFTMSMQSATKYKGDPRFDSANFSRILQEARKELEQIDGYNTSSKKNECQGF